MASCLGVVSRLKHRKEVPNQRKRSCGDEGVKQRAPEAGTEHLCAVQSWTEGRTERLESPEVFCLVLSCKWEEMFSGIWKTGRNSKGEAPSEKQRGGDGALPTPSIQLSSPK